MAKTLTLANTKMQSIQLNRVPDKDGKIIGIASALNYVVVDADGTEVMYKNSTKYTAGAGYPSDSMSADAEKKLTDYWNAMVALMKEREEL